MLDLQDNIYDTVKKTYYMSAGEDVVVFVDLNIDIFLEVQNKRYCQISYLIAYVVPGLNFW